MHEILLVVIQKSMVIVLMNLSMIKSPHTASGRRNVSRVALGRHYWVYI